MYGYTSFIDAATTLRDARRSAGLTQAALAKRTKTSQATISAYEGGTKTPSLPTFIRLLDATGTRLRAERGHALVCLPGREEQRRIGRELVDVISLAAELPTRHPRRLTYPRLGA